MSSTEKSPPSNSNSSNGTSFSRPPLQRQVVATPQREAWGPSRSTGGVVKHSSDEVNGNASEEPAPLIAKSLIAKFEQLGPKKSTTTNSQPNFHHLQHSVSGPVPQSVRSPPPSSAPHSQKAPTSILYTATSPTDNKTASPLTSSLHETSKSSSTQKSRPPMTRSMTADAISPSSPSRVHNNNNTDEVVDRRPLLRNLSSVLSSANVPTEKEPIMLRKVVPVERPPVIPEDMKTTDGIKTVSAAVEVKCDCCKLPDDFSLDEWDPRAALKQLYSVSSPNTSASTNGAEDEESLNATLSGYLDKLPDQKKLTTMLKTWKKRYFVLEKGVLKYYESHHKLELRDSFEISGGVIEDQGQRVISIDDKRGRFFVIRCNTDTEQAQWLRALRVRAAQQQATLFVPLQANPSPSKQKIVVLDMGSCSLRAGVLCEAGKLPDVYMPHVVALNKSSQQVLAVGVDAFDPKFRSSCQIYAPLKCETTLENFAFEKGIVTHVVRNVFQRLRVEPKEYALFLILPPNVSEETRIRLAEVVLSDVQCRGVLMCCQSVVALQAYQNTSGVLVDLGYRTEIRAVTAGVVQWAAVSRHLYGGHSMVAALTRHLVRTDEGRRRWNRNVEQVLLRYILEKSCVVAPSKRLIEFTESANAKDVPLKSLDLPAGFPESVHVRHGVALTPEGLFRARAIFGMETPSLVKQIHSAIQTCPMDFRRTLYRSIYLSGGTSLVPGIAERLQKDLTALLPSSNIVVQVHTAQHREHAAFCGAFVMATQVQGFLDAMIVTRNEWISVPTGAQTAADHRRRLVGKWLK